MSQRLRTGYQSSGSEVLGGIEGLPLCLAALARHGNSKILNDYTQPLRFRQDFLCPRDSFLHCCVCSNESARDLVDAFSGNISSTTGASVHSLWRNLLNRWKGDPPDMQVGGGAATEFREPHGAGLPLVNAPIVDGNVARLVPWIQRQLARISVVLWRSRKPELVKGRRPQVRRPSPFHPVPQLRTP